MIKYVKGDATFPTGDGVRVIVHSCNDEGGWGPAGASTASSISKRWKDPEAEYRQQFEAGEPGLKLGEVQLVDVGAQLWVANCIAQRGYRRPGNLTPFRYEAFSTCCEFLVRTFSGQNASFHMPKVGCGLGGADWHSVEHILQKTLVAAELPVTVYTL